MPVPKVVNLHYLFTIRAPCEQKKNPLALGRSETDPDSQLRATPVVIFTPASMLIEKIASRRMDVSGIASYMA